MAMIDDLDAAMETLYTFASAGDGILMRDFDISSFKGDSRLWVSFANTLKLRMAIRMSGVEPKRAASPKRLCAIWRHTV